MHGTVQDLQMVRHWHCHSFHRLPENASLPSCHHTFNARAIPPHPRSRPRIMRHRTPYTIYANHNRFWGLQGDYLLLPGNHNPFCVRDSTALSTWQTNDKSPFHDTNSHTSLFFSSQYPLPCATILRGAISSITPYVHHPSVLPLLAKDSSTTGFTKTLNYSLNNRITV